MGGAAEGSAAEEHGALLLHAVGVGRHVGAPASYALHRDAQARRPRTKPDGRDHRQSGRQGGSKGGSAFDPQGFDAGKKVTGRKRHILVDTLGLLLNVIVHPAKVPDCDAALLLLDRPTRRLFPFIECIFVDAGYQSANTAAAIAKNRTWTLEIVKRNVLHRFAVLPKRWIVERSLATINHRRRLGRAFERYARTVAAFIRLAPIRIMLQRLIKSAPLFLNQNFLALTDTFIQSGLSVRTLLNTLVKVIEVRNTW